MTKIKLQKFNKLDVSEGVAGRRSRLEQQPNSGGGGYGGEAALTVPRCRLRPGGGAGDLGWVVPQQLGQQQDRLGLQQQQPCAQRVRR